MAASARSDTADLADAPLGQGWRDIREWVSAASDLGEVRTVTGASWESEIGEATAALDRNYPAPAVLFDEVLDYPKGYRVLVNANGSPRRQCLTLGIDPGPSSHSALMTFWREALGKAPIEPTYVEAAPFLENVLKGRDVDLARFPAPMWHPEDGGRFLGTAGMTVLRDPDTGVINVGTYRGQILAPDELGVLISPGHHGRTIIDKYVARGEACPVVSIMGTDPLLFMASCAEGLAFGQSELGWAGGIRGKAIDVVRGPITGLPIPATAEIVLEGFIAPDERREEGPYGEWHGYYSGGSGQTFFNKVQAIYHRDDPIVTGCPQGRPPHEDNYFLAYLKSALAERQLMGTAVPNVKGVWCPPEFGNRLMTVVAIEQAYPGHATQVGMLAGQLNATAYGGRIVVVVDADIDITDIREVMWAVTTRVDPAEDVQVVRRAWSSALDTAVRPGSHGMNSRLILDATRPWEHRHQFPRVVSWPGGNAAADQRWAWLFQSADGNDLSPHN